MMELLFRAAVPVGTLLFLPAVVALGVAIRKWDVELGVFYGTRLRFWKAVHDAAERVWHWTYRKHLEPLRDRKARQQTPPAFYMNQAVEHLYDNPKPWRFTGDDANVQIRIREYRKEAE